MTRPSKIWAVSSGEYSSYQVLALFPTEAMAEEAATAENTIDPYSRAFVEEFTLYTEVPQPVTRYERSIEIFDDGTTGRETEFQRTEMPFNMLHPAAPRPSVRLNRAPYIAKRGARLDVRGTRKKAVDQAFSDNLARIRVNAEQTGRATL